MNITPSREPDLRLPLSPDDPRPLYRQVADAVKEAIAAGALQPGDRLPSVRELADRLGVSVITTRRAYLELEGAGYLRSRPGLGTFVAELDPAALNARALEELRGELEAIVARAARRGIPPAEIVRLVRELAGGRGRGE